MGDETCLGGYSLIGHVVGQLVGLSSDRMECKPSGCYDAGFDAKEYTVEALVVGDLGHTSAMLKFSARLGSDVRVSFDLKGPIVVLLGND